LEAAAAAETAAAAGGKRENFKTIDSGDEKDIFG
jgi:hypothetical protein